jgi:NAD(P)-dependent dehydrogenase (short-subunit alcohol dehydrogenase family)
MTVFSNEEMRRSFGPLTGQTVVVIGGSRGIGRATALEARAQGANVILTGRNPNHLRLAAQEVGALSTAAFDATPAPAWPSRAFSRRRCRALVANLALALTGATFDVDGGEQVLGKE